MIPIIHLIGTLKYKLWIQNKPVCYSHQRPWRAMHSTRPVIMKAVPLRASRKEHSHVFLASSLHAGTQAHSHVQGRQALDHWATFSVAVKVSDSSLQLLCQSFLFTGLTTVAPRNAWSASHKAIQIIPDHYAIPSDTISPCHHPDAISSHLQATARVVLAALSASTDFIQMRKRQKEQVWVGWTGWL